MGRQERTLVSLFHSGLDDEEQLVGLCSRINNKHHEDRGGPGTSSISLGDKTFSSFTIQFDSSLLQCSLTRLYLIAELCSSTFFSSSCPSSPESPSSGVDAGLPPPFEEEAMLYVTATALAMALCEQRESSESKRKGSVHGHHAGRSGDHGGPDLS